MNKKYAVILSGCGAKDGAEIHESVAALIEKSKARNQYTIIAPKINKQHVINHGTDAVQDETRNVLVEANRIARGEAKSLEELDVEQFDGLVIPGGFGAAKNLFDFAFNGFDFTVLPLFEEKIRAFHTKGKPIAAMCISPVAIAKIFSSEKVEVTFGADSPMCKEAEAKFGVKITPATRNGVVIDQLNKVVTTPSYMYGDSTIADIASGAENLIAELDKL